jgi:hypothetical protein
VSVYWGISLDELVEHIRTAKAVKKVVALHEIWKSKGVSLDSGHLDEVASILLSIAEEGHVRDILNAWEDRVISF